MDAFDLRRIAANREARDAAAAVWALIDEETDRQDERAQEAFWSRLETYLRAARPDMFAVKAESVPPMSDVEARRFENEIMPFGQHQDGQIKHVPLDYLHWLAGQDDFRGKLNRYLRNERVQREGE